MKKVLLVATVQSHIAQFHKPTIISLKSKGYRVDVAAHNNLHLKKNLTLTEPDNIYEIPFSRSPYSLKNIKAYKALKTLIKNGKYDIVHCNTPVGGILTRWACRKLRKQGLKVIYEAHGFHFFKGSSKLNWLLWYPIEKFFSRFTDALVLINKMDYELAESKFNAKKTYRIPGVGVNLSQFNNISTIDIRQELGISDLDPIVLSVGELNQNKNHKAGIKALSLMENKSVHYCIAGNGPLADELKLFAAQCGVEERVHFLGYRRDLPSVFGEIDVFLLPSYREGLGMAAIEAMSCGVPLVSSNRHGINDYSIDGVTGFKCHPDNHSAFAESIQTIISDKDLASKLSENCKEIAKQFSLEESVDKILQIYKEVSGDL
ncbi:MAG: glycosyltransferase family 4 protein [Clostridia bacterium]|nr:glycosyltransferase family 4 protein [Clostridia bacterium]